MSDTTADGKDDDSNFDWHQGNWCCWCGLRRCCCCCCPCCRFETGDEDNDEKSNRHGDDDRYDGDDDDLTPPPPTSIFVSTALQRKRERLYEGYISRRDMKLRQQKRSYKVSIRCLIVYRNLGVYCFVRLDVICTGVAIPSVDLSGRPAGPCLVHPNAFQYALQLLLCPCVRLPFPQREISACVCTIEVHSIVTHLPSREGKKSIC